MSRFLQLHFLTVYAPSNLNRDDLGRPKTALFGGTQRLRVSSQSLKRAWRTSEGFTADLKGHIGTRTKDFGNVVHAELVKGMDAAKAGTVAKQVAAVFGTLKTKGDEEAQRQTETLVHVTPSELASLKELGIRLGKEKREPSEDELASLVATAAGAADIALFGRMLAAKPGFNVEAAAQVAHALSVHKVVIEDDYFTAVDDLNAKEDTGAGHVGTQEFASAVLYHYVCIDRALLAENLGNDEALKNKTVAAFTKACLTVAPTGKQNSFASRSLASYVLAEKGDFQPRSLAVAFLEPVKGDAMLVEAIQRLGDTKASFDKVYGSAPASCHFDTTKNQGTLAELVSFVAEA
ncbi:MAG: type I-E CRISPR-associated protein Cas7/Cse4/CasC [Deltaproteobacteria bacterium]|nr:type I-E CRISPR-associated protein Cas7/Cse4/CasC [Deltaproteobacteria bacterium]